MDIIIGSWALRYHARRAGEKEKILAENVLVERGKDVDVLTVDTQVPCVGVARSSADEKERAFVQSLREREGRKEVFVESLTCPELQEFAWECGVMGEDRGRVGFASLDELYTIKLSHSFWELRNGSWDKHMNDMLLLGEMGAHVNEELYAILYSMWETRYGKKKVNLEKEEREFFTGAVKRVYEHDSVHAALAGDGNTPAFYSILRDGHTVAVDRVKFESLSFSDQLKCASEEAGVIAFERKSCFNGGKNWRSDYLWAMKKLMTTLSKGWFARFIAENWSQLCAPEFNFVEKIYANEHLLVPVEGDGVVSHIPNGQEVYVTSEEALAAAGSLAEKTTVAGREKEKTPLARPVVNEETLTLFF